MKLNTSRKSGFTLVEIMIVVAIIGLLAAIAIPNFVKARSRAQTNACIANLKQLQGATETYLLEKKSSTYPDAATLVSEGFLKSTPTCPGGGTYTAGSSTAEWSCSLSADGHVLP